MSKASKKLKIIDSVCDIYSNNKGLIVAEYQGLSVLDLSTLRKSLRINKGGLRVVKNSLSKIAAKKAKKDEIIDILEGPVLICYSNDYIAMAKDLVSFSKANQDFKLLGGMIEDVMCDKAKILDLSKVPSIEAVRSKLISLIKASASQLASIVQSPALNIIGLINAFNSTKKNK